jgi:serine/threonine-protein kinase RsbT
MMERFVIRTESDIGIAVVATQARARALGLSGSRVDRLGTAVSELARNIVKYAQQSGGDLLLHLESSGDQKRLTLQARDNGPGIPDLEAALQDHYSTSGTLGLGLPGVRRMVDAFQIHSIPGSGTVVTITMEE